MNEKERAARGTTLITGQTIFSGVLRMLSLAVLARLLLQEEMGQIAILTIVFGFMQFIGALGLNYASPLFIPEYEKKGHMGLIKAFLLKSMLLIILTSILLIVIVLIFFETMLGWSGIGESLVLLVVIIGPFSSLEVYLDSFVLARSKYIHLTIGRIIFEIVRFVIIVILVLSGFGVAGVLGGWLFSEFVAVVFFFKVVIKDLDVPYEKLAISSIIGFSLSNLIFQIIDVSIQSIDRLVLGVFVNMNSLGVFDVLLRFLQIFSLLSLSISTSLFPFITRKRVELESSQDHNSGIASIVYNLIRYVLIILLPIAIVSAINSHSLLLLLFGSNYAEFPNAVLSFSLLLMTYTLWGVVYSIYTVLRSMGQGRFFLISGILIIVIELSTSMYLISKFELLGASITRSIYVFLLFLIAYAKLRELGISKLGKIIPSLLRILLASLAAGLFVWLLSPEGIIPMLISMVMAVGIYFALIFLLKEAIESDFRTVKLVLPSMFHSFIDKLWIYYNKYKKEVPPFEEG